jgi:hypothetical protein
MNLIKFFVSENYRHEYTKDFSDKLEKEQQQNEDAYRESLKNNL